jgi:uncharacterized protein (TIGR00255 family)
MPRSMTGFGRSELKCDRYEISIEIRGINNRFLDIGLKLPKSLDVYECMIKQLIKEKVHRGKITVNVYYKDLALSNNNFSIKKDTVEFYYNLLKQIKAQTNVKGDITLDHLLTFKEIIEPEGIELEDKQLESDLSMMANRALDSFNDMRMKEAENIEKDIFQYLMDIEKKLKVIEKRGKNNPASEFEKLKKRIRVLIQDNQIDKGRLEMELAIIVDRIDISEECSRLRSHIIQFREIYRNGNEVGKALSFILQEMQREINTVGSKTTDIKITHGVIMIKEGIEKIREQVQNLE